MSAVDFAVLGCGYVADFYMATLRAHPDLRCVGVFDTDPHRLDAFSRTHGVRAYTGFDALLGDETSLLVLNLTNPRSHFHTTHACLEAGKHVYSEKPLAMDSQAAEELAALARRKGLRVATAPCSLLSATAQTLWKGVRDGLVGPVRLVYASFDDGMVHRHGATGWRSKSGAPWPAKDEFEIGCTYEHAAYVLSWLAAMFGPARRVHAYASVQLPEKGVTVDSMAPDFTVGCIEYDNRVVARVTCSIVAPLDKSIRVIGDHGTMYAKYVRNDSAPVYVHKTTAGRLRRALGRRLGQSVLRLERLLHLPVSVSGFGVERKVPYAVRPTFRFSAGGKPVDFLLGPAEMAGAIREDRPCRLSPELAVHMVELIETLQYPDRFERPRTLRTSFDPIAPLG